MNEDRIEMSRSERDRLKVMSLVLASQCTQVESARLMGLSERQVRRVQRKLDAGGGEALIHTHLSKAACSWSRLGPRTEPSGLSRGHLTGLCALNHNIASVNNRPLQSHPK